MVTHIDELLSVILHLCIDGGDLSPATLHNIGRFAELVVSFIACKFVDFSQHSAKNTFIYQGTAEHRCIKEVFPSGREHSTVGGVQLWFKTRSRCVRSELMELRIVVGF
jgi:hypothetical protein